MRLEIHFRNTDASEDEKKALRARVERKIRKVTRFLKDPVTVEMNIKGEKVGFYGDLHITSAGTSTLKARIEGDDPVAVIDGLLHTVGRAARRNHDRVVTRHHKPAPATDGFAMPSFELADNEDEDLATAEIQRDLGHSA
ncbi:MAG: HPF/RaiA family ribosome-associated protein [Alphaproteobacteria bacterium]|nr:HPF/RaiA family ribosome-associated protein [Alphaproteobacteria bacterium]